jgi:hypothetical protein
LKHAEKRVIYPIIISEEVITSGEVRERIEETASKMWKTGTDKKKRKQPRKKKSVVILNSQNPKQRFKWCSFVSKGGF